MAERLYTIGPQIPTRALIGGRLVDVLEIHYTGPSDITGWVRVPVDTLNAEQVDTLIRNQLTEQLRVASLGAS